MNEEQAKNICKNFCKNSERTNQLVRIVDMKDGSWIFIDKEGALKNRGGAFEGVAVGTNGNTFTS